MKQEPAAYPSISLQLNHETVEAIYFYMDVAYPINNWSAHAVVVEGVKFPTVEHAYHYLKFKGTAPDVAAQVLAAPSPWAAKQVADTYGDKRRTDWDEVKVDIMTDLNRAKMEQNEDARECLKSSGSKTLVENSPVDFYWGCGVDGKGENVMGKILMKIREELVAADAA